eukprot:c26561_g1_i1 orf=392-2086(-)
MGRPVIADGGIGFCVAPADLRQLSSRLRNTVLMNARVFPAVVFLDKASLIRIRNSVETVDSNIKQNDLQKEQQTKFRGVHKCAKSSCAASWNHSETFVGLTSPDTYSISSFNYEAAAKALEILYTEGPSPKPKFEERSRSSAVERLDTSTPKEMNCLESNISAQEETISGVSDQSFGKSSVSCFKRTTKRERQKRLDLRTRVSLRRKRLQKGLVGSRQPTSQEKSRVGEGVNIWSMEADALITEYGVCFCLMVGGWDNLSRDLLSPEEENRLATIMKRTKQLQELKLRLQEDVGREPSEEEWAKAVKMDVRKLRRFITVGKAARNKFLQLNLRLVLSQACKYYKRGMALSVPDLCQEGLKGLFLAIEKFEPKKGFRFSTYAIYWIRNSIIRAQTRSGHPLRLPFNVAALKITIKKTTLELLLELGRAPTHEEIMQRLGLEKGRYIEVLRSGRENPSLHNIDRITGKQVFENVADPEETSTTHWNLSGETMLRLGVDDVLDSLKPKESLVLRQRFGLEGKGRRSLGEIGRNLKMSREMARKYEARGLLKLKHPTRQAYLRSFLMP